MKKSVIGRIASQTGDLIAEKFATEMEGRSDEHAYEVLARIDRRQRPSQSSANSAFNSVPVPLRFDPSVRKLPPNS